MKHDAMTLAPLDRCTGCGSCVSSCRLGAVSMETDDAGFLQPRIDSAKCVGCGACVRACPVISSVESGGDSVQVFAATNPDDQLRRASSSVGVFSVLAQAVLEQGGSVYGCAWQSRSQAAHIRVTCREDLHRLRKSKYVQSHTGTSFREAKILLNAGEQVLFSGTPCQIAGLKAYLGKDYDNLLLVDFVCHGVPNDAMLEAFLQERQRSLGTEVTGIDFRCRRRGVGNYLTGLILKGPRGPKTLMEPWMGTSYGYLFMGSYITRESCLHCPYASTERCSDITLGDYWGIRDAHPELDAFEGVGLVIASSEKGRRWLSAVAGKLELTPSTMDAAARGNAQLRGPARAPERRQELLQAWRREGYAPLHRFYRSQWRKTVLPRYKTKLKIVLFSRLLGKDGRKSP